MNCAHTGLVRIKRMVVLPGLTCSGPCSCLRVDCLNSGPTACRSVSKPGNISVKLETRNWFGMPSNRFGRCFCLRVEFSMRYIFHYYVIHIKHMMILYLSKAFKSPLWYFNEFRKHDVISHTKGVFLFFF